MQKLLKLYTFAILFSIKTIAYADAFTYENVWNTLRLTGHFKPETKYFYDISTHWRFNTKYKVLKENLDSIFLGVDMSAHISGALGFELLPRWFPNTTFYEQRIAQQITYVKQTSDQKAFIAYNRLEERWLHNFSGISIRDRVKFEAFFCQLHKYICPLVASETFFSLNKVVWNPVKTLSEQRSYAGLEFVITNRHIFRFGYLNQYIRLLNNKLNFNILEMQLIYNLD